MGSKHTPGPWTAAEQDSDGRHVISGHGPYDEYVEVGEVYGDETEMIVYTEARANAALIAAAPDMKLALEAARAGFEILTADPEDHDFCRACGGYIPRDPEGAKRRVGHKRGCTIVSSKSAIDAALAKAEGR